MNLEDRGVFFIEPGAKCYEGMVVGQHARDNDLVVNVAKGKKLTNMRASGSDDATRLTPPRLFSLEPAIEFIDDDGLGEITPGHVRLRKKILDAHERKKSEKGTRD
jgi:GTP-binding protein